MSKLGNKNKPFKLKAFFWILQNDGVYLFDSVNIIIFASKCYTLSFLYILKQKIV